MYSHKLKKLPKNTLEILIDVPWKDMLKQYDTALEHLTQELQVEGFRKGKVPKAVAEKQFSREQIFQHAIQDLLPQIYSEIVKKEGLKPIINPKIELLKAKEEEDWQLRAIVAERPTVTLPDYKKIVKDLKAEQKKSDIWVPGKDKSPEEEKAREEQKRRLLDSILGALVQKSKVEIPDVIVEEEVNARLSRLLDEVQKIGLTMDAYLKSKNLTSEQLRASLTREVEEVHQMEFVLNEIADKEGVQVEQKELDSIFGKITNEKERKEAEANAYFYASILRKQKTLDFLLNL